MEKIDTLRAAITEALPEFSTDPDRLKVWIERGTGKSTQTEGHGFVFAFQLNVLVVGMATDIAHLALAIFRWLRVNQPELMVPGADGFGFDADILDNGSADVLIQLQLDQGVSATPRDDGKFDLAYTSEPDPLFVDFFGTQAALPLPDGAIEEDASPPWEP